MEFSCRTCRPSPTPQKESTTIQIQSGAIEARHVEQVAGFHCTKAILQEDISKLSSEGKLQRHIPGAAGAVMPVISRCSAVQSTRCRSSSFSERSNATPSEADDAKPPGIQRTEDWIHTCKMRDSFSGFSGQRQGLASAPSTDGPGDPLYLQWSRGFGPTKLATSQPICVRERKASHTEKGHP